MTQTQGTRRQHTHGAPCWASVMVHDPVAGQEFYRGLFGWEFTVRPERAGPYVRATLDGREVAGMGTAPPDVGYPVTWMPYLASDDVDATAELIRHCGGTVAVGPLDAGEAGRMVIAADPDGAVFGVWQAAAADGPGVTGSGAAGVPTWLELVTHTTAGPAAFYPALFGYTAKPSPGGNEDRVTLYLEGEPVATVRATDPEQPSVHGPHWRTGFAVDDTEASVRRAVELGGRPVHPPHRTPYGIRATVADPEGARFSVLQRTGD
ncbi:VOC family protein [Streptomyces sp. TR06-5]|uniref:VOC family protein n=1 Tax=unclassified Streptomyces TaxID=2593676 RepID=UPI00399FE47B